MDVTVSSIGNADSLQGGVLLQTPCTVLTVRLFVARSRFGRRIVGGQRRWGNVQVNHPTVGMVSNGATVERDREPSPQKRGIELIGRSPDSSTAVKIADAVNQYYPGTSLPKMAVWSTFGFLPTSKVKRLTFLLRLVESTPSPTSPRVINERTGTIVATKARFLRCGKQQQYHYFSNPTTGVSQPLPFPPEQRLFWRVKTPNSLKKSVGSKLWMSWTPRASTVNELASALNKLGLTTREMTSISNQ